MIGNILIMGITKGGVVSSESIISHRGKKAVAMIIS